MTWQTFNVKRRDDGYGPYALLSDDRQLSSEAILLQRNAAGETRAVLGFLVGTEYVPIEKVPGWTGKTGWQKYVILGTAGAE